MSSLVVWSKQSVFSIFGDFFEIRRISVILKDLGDCFLWEGMADVEPDTAIQEGEIKIGTMSSQMRRLYTVQLFIKEMYDAEVNRKPSRWPIFRSFEKVNRFEVEKRQRIRSLATIQNILTNLMKMEEMQEYRQKHVDKMIDADIFYRKGFIVVKSPKRYVEVEFDQ